MLSVVLTFQKVFLLIARCFWTVISITLTSRLLQEILGREAERIPKHSRSPLVFLGLSAILVSFVLGAMSDAALLGILKKPESEVTFALRIFLSIKKYTWVLFRLSLLIGIIAVVLLIPFSLFSLWLRLRLFEVAFAVMYLVLLKYALAYPIAVNEDTTAYVALKRSWEMTKGRFWYVVFCYLIMGVGGYMLQILLQSNWMDARFSFTGFFIIKLIVLGFVDSLWIVLGWQMYREIKDVPTSEIATRMDELSPPPRPPSSSTNL